MCGCFLIQSNRSLQLYIREFHRSGDYGGAFEKKDVAKGRQEANSKCLSGSVDSCNAVLSVPTACYKAAPGRRWGHPSWSSTTERSMITHLLILGLMFSIGRRKGRPGLQVHTRWKHGDNHAVTVDRVYFNICSQAEGSTEPLFSEVNVESQMWLPQEMQPLFRWPSAVPLQAHPRILILNSSADLQVQRVSFLFFFPPFSP